jgi:probable HAF family extracellular repeat protein
MQIKRQLQAALVAEAILLLAAINSMSIAFAGGGGPPPATHTHYGFTTIDIPDGVDGVFAYGVNDEGLVSGFYEDSSAYYHGFLWKDGTVRTVDAPGDWADTYLGSGNDLGVVIGNYDDDLTVSHATLYRVWDQTWTRLPDVPGCPLNYGNAINNYGIAVGAAYQGTPTDYYGGVGWIWDGRHYSLFTVPEASGLAYGTYAAGINDSGKVSGLYQDSQNVYHGFLKHGQNITSLDVPGAEDTFAYGINNQDEVVGYYFDGSAYHGVIMQAGKFVTVDVPGATNTQIFGINNRDQIVGWYSDTSNPNGWGFVATPIDGER